MGECDLPTERDIEARQPPAEAVTRLSAVVPVYRGEHTLRPLVADLAALAERPVRTPAGAWFQLTAVILVHDGGPDRSDEVIEKLAAEYPIVSPVWLSRNFGQHAATLAGIAVTTTPWVVTLDEDGLFPPQEIGRLLDAAHAEDAPLVYGQPLNPPPHGLLRNVASGAAKWLFKSALPSRFSSFRLIDGEIARGVAAYCGHGIYLDSALSWVASHSAQCRVAYKSEEARPSGYNYRRLFGHFGRLVMSSGARPLRLVSLLGLFSLLLALGIAAHAIWQRVTGQVPVSGWTSLIVAVSWFSGCILFAIGIVAEYLGAVLMMSFGKPLYLVTSRPRRQRPEPPEA